MEEHHNIIMGATGGGKTYLANAFGVAVARKLHSVRYVRLPDLLGEPTLADAICDRIVHDSYRIVIAEHNRDDSLSMRKRKGPMAH